MSQAYQRGYTYVLKCAGVEDQAAKSTASQATDRALKSLSRMTGGALGASYGVQRENELGGAIGGGAAGLSTPEVADPVFDRIIKDVDTDNLRSMRNLGAAGKLLAAIPAVTLGVPYMGSHAGSAVQGVGEYVMPDDEDE